MKFGICTNMNVSNTNKIGIEQFAFFANAGFDYLELPLGEIMLLDDDEYAYLRKELKKSGIPCKACNVIFHGGISITGPDADISKIKNYCESALVKASEIGAEVVVFGSPKARNFPPGFPKDKAYEQVDEAISIIGQIASDFGIIVALEQTNPAEGNVFSSFREVMEAAQRASHPHIKCNIDNYHLFVVMETISIFRGIGDMLGHVHISGLIGRYMPLQENELDYKGFFSSLKKEKYDNFISIEGNAKNIAIDSKHSLDMLRKLWIES